MCRSLESCKWENVHHPRTHCASSPPSLSHLIARAHVLSSEDTGKSLLPPHRTLWMVRGRLQQQKKKAATPHLPETLTGGSPMCFQHPHLGGVRTLPHTHRCQGWRDRQRSIYQLVSRRRRWRGGSRRGGDRGRSERFRLGSRRGLDRTDGRGLASSGLGSAGSGRLARSGFSTLDSARAAASL